MLCLQQTMRYQAMATGHVWNSRVSLNVVCALLMPSVSKSHPLSLPVFTAVLLRRNAGSVPSEHMLDHVY